MKIILINVSGNVGKTTLARHLIAPHLPGAKRISIEDINAGDGVPDAQVAAGKFKQLAAELSIADEENHFVVDLGASVAREMLAQLEVLRSARGDFDYWIVPVVPSSKEMEDSIKTVAELVRIGVKPGKILVVANNVTDVDGFDDEFAPIKDLAEALGAKFCAEAVLASDAFSGQRNQDLDVITYAESEPDFKALLKATVDKDERLKIGMQRVQHDLCFAAAGNLRAVWSSMPMAADLATA